MDEPCYPSGPGNSIPRRNFFALVGQAAAMAAIGATGISCSSSTLHKGRLPLTDSHSAFTSDWGDLGYIVHTEHEIKRFSDYLREFEPELLAQLNQIFANSYSVNLLSEEEGIQAAEAEIMSFLENDYESIGQGDPGMVSLTLEIVRLRKNEGPDGMDGARVLNGNGR